MRARRESARLLEKRVKLEFDTEAFPPRGPLLPLVEFLKTYPPENVKELIGRRIAVGIHKCDTSEVLYWASVQALIFKGPLDADVIEQALPQLQKLACYSA